MPAVAPPFSEERIRFSGHETFPFRSAWPKKVVDAVADDPMVFTRDDALVRLGVGKNMVRSMRHWALVMGLVEEDPLARDRGRTLRVTQLGQMLFGPEGWDPYLEDPATLWLLHIQLAQPSSGATTWSYAFNGYRGLELSRERLHAGIIRHVEGKVARIHPATLDRDIDVFIRCYVPRRSGATLVEDSFDCPLTELELLRPLADERTFRFVIGPKATLPVEMIGYAFLRFLQRSGIQGDTIAFDACLVDPGSPGRLCKLDEHSLLTAFERLADITDQAIAFDETAGLRQVYIRRDRQMLQPEALLESYYARVSGP